MKNSPKNNEDTLEDLAFDYLNRDMTLLLVLNFLNHPMNTENSLYINVEKIFQFDAGNIGSVKSEFFDTGDYTSDRDMLMHWIKGIESDLEIIKLELFHIEFFASLPSICIEEIIKESSPLPDEHFQNYVSYCEKILKKSFSIQNRIGNDFQKMGDYEQTYDFITPDQYGDHSDIICFIPHAFDLKFRVKNDQSKELRAITQSFIASFSKDFYKSTLPNYLEKRVAFSLQLENFYKYVSALPRLGSVVNVPFSALIEEEEFEVVKVLFHLEQNNIIEKINWFDTDSWKVDFLQGLDSEYIHHDNMKKTRLTEIKEIGLSINENTGDVTLGTKRESFNPESREFKVLKCLLHSPDFQANYKKLISAYSENYSELSLTSQKKDLVEIIRNVKNRLGILPKKTRVNNDIFENSKSMGYRIKVP